MSRAYGYMIVLKDNASDNYTYGIPEHEDAPQVIFTSLEDAKVAIKKVVSNMDNFMPVAYGEAFPYDSVTFEQLIARESFAPYGWSTVITDEESYSICIGVLRLDLQA